MIHYHYYAIYQRNPGETVHIDGIVSREVRIRSWPEYQELKKNIAGFDGDKRIDPDGLTICSLTVIGESVGVVK